MERLLKFPNHMYKFRYLLNEIEPDVGLDGWKKPDSRVVEEQVSFCDFNNNNFNIPEFYSIVK